MIKRRGAHYSKLDFFDAAHIQGQRLIEGGAYSNKNQKFQTIDFFSVKELIFLHPRPYLLPRQNQVADLARTHFQYRTHSLGMDQIKVFWRWMSRLRIKRRVESKCDAYSRAALNRGRCLIEDLRIFLLCLFYFIYVFLVKSLISSIG